MVVVEVVLEVGAAVVVEVVAVVKTVEVPVVA